MTASDTPPLRLVSSATSTRPVTVASRRMSSAGSGAIQRRSSTRQPMPLGGQPGRHPQAHPQPVAERDDGQVAPVPVAAGAAHRDVAPATAPAARRGRASRRRRARCRSRVWYSAIGSRKTQTRPSASAPRPGRSAAWRPRRRAGPGRRRSGRGCRAARPARCRCGSGRRSLSGRRGRRSARSSGLRYWPWEKNGERRGLAADLVGRVVQVGQVLDLRDRQQPGQARRRGPGPGWTARRAGCRTPARRRTVPPARG